MVEVLKSTFEDYLPLIERSIKSADFIAIDTEFTGLVKSAKERTNLFDTSEERYQKLKKSMSQFTISQLGISTFKRQDKNSYSATTFNFYLYPSSFGPVDVRFLVQASSLQFLCKYDFDFNKFVYEGIPYLNKPQQKAMKNHLHSKALFQAKDRSNDIDERVLQALCFQVAEWLVKTEDDQQAILEVTDEEVPELRFVKSFIVRTELRQRFKNVWINVIEGEQRIIQISKRDEKDINSDTTKEDMDKLYESLKGFSRVFKMLKGGVPIIGHNMFLDLLLIYDKFHKPLPDTFEAFKTEIQAILPVIFDTKHICNSARNEHFRDSGLLENSSLQMLYQSLSSLAGQQFVIDTPSVVHTSDRYKDESRPHEAGFDAYMSGFVFLRLSHMLTFLNVNSTDVRPCPFRRYRTEMAPYKNKINIIRGNVNHVCLDGPDPPSFRPELLYVQSKHQSHDLHLMQLLKWFSRHGTVDVQITDSQRALVAASNYRCSKEILKAFQNHKMITVTKYNKWKHSPVIRRYLWAGAILSGGACVLALLSSRKKD
ncbi:poly(A)-specific ribonuclease PNLDC1-like [Mizuhopecten yessoensis]|uniref:Poly(A)-specific ribonuclease PARN-like domain-containing protein 1 n=1 Tax=Mizuhopecten yessoensis TaxID=6573 RepID=A0A210QTT4_MIZYE|nr:poly(A)-specific ribonuclease PNLDC1-like [Mizuhopecten yessoensis]OWF52139.1 Poly(A)-specific ribonuclease PARN-like domain-containing protein 1 [Mizuhopecten yessoensis]